MGILFLAPDQPLGVSYHGPRCRRGSGFFNSTLNLVFNNLSQPRLIEVLQHHVRYQSDSCRTESWNDAVLKRRRFDGKFGITSNITLDEPSIRTSAGGKRCFQWKSISVFPIFYSEKRPFFHGRMGLFNIAGTGGDGNMRTAVHTRRIINRRGEAS